MATILCVDDDVAVGRVLEEALRRIEHTAILSTNVDEALGIIARQPIDLVITDYRMPGSTGLDLIGTLERDGHNIPVIIMTGYSSVEHAVMSLRSGAIDYLTKPIRAETLRIAVNQALAVVRLQRQNEAYRQELVTLRGRHTILGESLAIRRVLDTASTVAPTRATVLLEGESGTGKELLARFIHEQSPRHEEPFVTINCAALPDGLVESALFGHEKGAFTGATARAQGAFERAHRGTLLLDEISEMRLELQAKLLRVIQEQEFERVGGAKAIQVDVRLIATTNRDLKAESAQGRFREDLFYRLSVVPIRMPPLRDRLQDVPLLVHHFVTRAAAQLNVEPPLVEQSTLDVLQTHSWPGNVRELANVVERAVILNAGGVLRPTAFTGLLDPSAAEGGGGDGNPGKPEIFDLGTLEADAIVRALRHTGGNRTQAAKLLGVSDRTLRNRLNKPIQKQS